MSKSSAVENRRQQVYQFLHSLQAYTEINEISEALGIKYSLIANDLKALEKKGLVVKKKDTSSKPAKSLYMATQDEVQDESLTSDLFKKLLDGDTDSLARLERAPPEALRHHLPQLLECLYKGESELQLELLKLLKSIKLPAYSQYFIDMFLNTHPTIEDNSESIELPHFEDGMKAYIYETLRNWRFSLSRPLNRPVYLIMQNQALKEIANLDAVVSIPSALIVL